MVQELFLRVTVINELILTKLNIIIKFKFQDSMTFFHSFLLET